MTDLGEDRDRAAGGHVARAHDTPTPLDEFLVHVLVDEVHEQTLFARFALDGIRHNLDLVMREEDLTAVAPTFFYVHAFLTHTANVSKLLWPPRPRIPGRGDRLRQELGVTGQLMIRDRCFRDFLEHFDERLEQWWQESPNHVGSDYGIAPHGAVSGIAPNEFLRHLDPYRLELYFRGDTFDLKAAVAELQRLHEASDAWLKCGSTAEGGAPGAEQRRTS